MNKKLAFLSLALLIILITPIFSIHLQQRTHKQKTNIELTISKPEYKNKYLSKQITKPEEIEPANKKPANLRHPLKTLEIKKAAKILLVDDDRSYNGDFESYYINTLNALGLVEGVDYIYWDTTVNGTPTKEALDSVAIVIWFTGLDPTSSSVLSEEDQQAIEYFLSRGGQLFLSSQYAGRYSDYYYEWYTKWLKASYEIMLIDPENVTGFSGTLFEGDFYELSGSDSANNAASPEDISPLGGAYSIFYLNSKSTWIVGITYDNASDYRLIYFTFPFESINGQGNRTNVMQKIISFMSNPITKIVGIKSYYSDTSEYLNVTVLARAYNNITSVKIYVNGTLKYSETPTPAPVYLKNVTLDLTDQPSGATVNVTVLVEDSIGQKAHYAVYVYPSLKVELLRPENYDVVWGTTTVSIRVERIRVPSITYINLKISNDTWSTTVDLTAYFNSTTGLCDYDWDTTALADGAYNLTVVVEGGGLVANDSAINIGSWNGPIPIMLVDEDNNNPGPMEQYYMDALSLLGYKRNFNYVYWDILTDGVPPAELLNRTVVAIWFYSGYSYPTSASANAIISYLGNMGQLFISLDELIYAPYTLREWLKTNYISTFNGKPSNVTGVYGSVFAGLYYEFFGSDTAGDIYNPAIVEPYNGSELVFYYDNNQSLGAGTMYFGEYRTVTVTFPFESINGYWNRTNFLKEVLDLFSYPLLKILQPINNTLLNNRTINVLIDARALKGLDTITIYVNGTLAASYKLNGERITRVKIPVDLTPFPDGTLKLEIYANSTDVRLSKKVIYIKSDKTDPTLEIQSPENNSYTQYTSIVVDWQGSDNMGIDHYEIKIDNGAWINVGTSTAYGISGLSEGEHIIMVKAIDIAGNEVVEVLVVTVDVTAPTVNITSPADGSYLNTTYIYVEWEDSDNFGVGYYEISINGGDWIDVGLNTSYTVENVTEGGYTIEVKIYDLAGNYASCYISVIVDLTPPYVDILSPKNGTYFNVTSVTIAWTGGDQYKDHYEIRIDGGSWINVGTDTSYSFSGLSEGIHIVDVKIFDLAGNYDVDSVAILIDITAPTILIISPSNGSYFSYSDVLVSWNGSDNMGIAYYEVSIDGGSWFSVGVSTERTFTFSEGVHVVGVRAVDNAGNYGEVSVVIFVDISPPSITVLAPTSQYVTVSKVLIVWNGSDNFGIDHYEVRVDGGAWVYLGLSTNYTAYLDEGSHTVDIKAVDYAGNYEVRSFEIIVDITGPTVAIVEPENLSYFNVETVTVYWEGTDNFGIDHYEVRIDGGSWIDVGDNEYYTFYDLEIGYHTIEVKAVDYAGLSNTTSIIIVIDMVQPTIDILEPKDNTYTNSTTILVTWDGSDNYGLDHYEVIVDSSEPVILSINTTTYSVEGLTEGFHEIKVRAVDLAGNTMADVVRVVVDLTPPIVNITYPLLNSYVNTSLVVIRWDSSDNFGIDHFVLLVDGSRYVTQNNSLAIHLDEGSRQIILVAYDRAGNPSRTNSTFIVDVTAPTIKISEPENNSVLTNTEIEVSWVCSDNFELDHIEIAIDGGEYKNLGLANSTVVELGYGEHKITIVAYDKAGNKNSVTLVLTIQEETKATEESEGAQGLPTLGIAVAITLVAIVIGFVGYILRKRKLSMLEE